MPHDQTPPAGEALKVSCHLLGLYPHVESYFRGEARLVCQRGPGRGLLIAGREKDIERHG
jgi:hypothetical protein